jgi:hypothetical protein
VRRKWDKKKKNSLLIAKAVVVAQAQMLKSVLYSDFTCLPAVGQETKKNPYG